MDISNKHTSGKSAHCISFDQLVSGLNIKQSQLTITNQTLDGEFTELLSQYYFYQGQCIKINNALKTVNESLNTLEISGRASYLNIANVPVKATFTLLEDGQLQTQIHYQMMASARAANRWKFSDSFPALPKEEYSSIELPSLKSMANTTTVSAQKGSKASLTNISQPRIQQYLDNLEITESNIIVSSHDVEYEGIPLEKGINFSGKMRPTGFLGLIECFIPKMEPVPVFGKIVVPCDDTQIDMSALNYDVASLVQFPWQMQDYPPYGIYLNVKLDLDFKVGGAQFTDTYVRFFRPLTKQLENSAHHYAPVTAFTGSLAIPSADLSLHMTSLIDPAASSLAIYGEFDGFSIENLSQLASICGPKGLSNQLPSSLSDVLGPLKKLALTDLGIRLSWGQTGIQFDEIALGLGMPDLKWNVWKDHVVVNGIGAKFYLNRPFSNLQTRISLWGKSVIEGVPVDIEGSKSGEEMCFLAKLSDAEIPLTKMMKRYVPGIPAPANLTINALQMNFSPGNYLAMQGSLAQAPDSWELDLGPSKLVICNVQFTMVSLMGGRGNAGSFRGDLNIGKNIKISTNYNLPGEFVIRGEAGLINFKEILQKLTGQKVKLPKGLDFTLTDASIMIKKGREGLVLQLASQVQGFGYMAFEVKKVNGKWGAAAGISMDPIHLSDIPGLKPLKAIEKVALMEDFTMVVSTYDGPQFRFPDMASFSNPVLAGNNNVQLPASSGGVISGLNLYSKWQLNSGGKETKLLKNILGLDADMAVTLQVSNPPDKQSSMFTTLETKLNGKWPMTAKVGLALNKGTPEFYAAGNTQVKINRKPYDFDMALSFVSSGAYFSGSMLGTANLNGVKLSNLALMASMNWGGVPSLGIAGTVDVDTFSSSIALFFDSTDPSKSIFAGSVSDINLKDIATVFASAKKMPKGIEQVLKGIELTGTGKFVIANSLCDALDNIELAALSQAFKKEGGITLPSSQDQVLLVIKQKGKRWSLTNMYDKMKHYTLVKKRNGIEVTLDSQVYCVPRFTRIGNLQFSEGFFMNGCLKVLGQTATSKIEISPSKGIAVDSKLDKSVVIHNKKFFQLSAVDNLKQGPELSISTFNQSKHPVKEFRKPHFYVNGRLYLMGVEGECYASISKKGCFYNLSLERTNTLKIPSISGKVIQSTLIDGSFGSLKSMYTGVETQSRFDMAINFGQLGKLKFKSLVSGKIKIDYNGKRAKAAFQGSFRLKGKSQKIKLALRVNSNDLENIASLIAKEVKNTYSDIFQDANQWSKFAKDGFMDGVNGAQDSAKVLSKHFNKSAKDTAKALKAAGHTMDNIGDSLKSIYKLDHKDMTTALKGAGYAASSVNKYVNKSYKAVFDAAKKAEEAARKKAAAAKKKAAEAKKKSEQAARKKAAAAKKKAAAAKKKSEEAARKKASAAKKKASEAKRKTKRKGKKARKKLKL